MDKFLETYSPPKLNQEETNNLNRQIIRSEMKSVINNKKSKTNKKTSLQKNQFRTRWLHWRILLNIQWRTYPDPSQTLPEDWRGGSTPKVILWSHHHTDNRLDKTLPKKKLSFQPISLVNIDAKISTKY